MNIFGVRKMYQIWNQRNSEDPMFHRNMPIIPSHLVFAIIIVIYRTITYFASKSEKFEDVIEGERLYVIEDGQFVLGVKNDHNFTKDGFFAEM